MVINQLMKLLEILSNYFHSFVDLEQFMMVGMYIENNPDWFKWGERYRVRLKLKKGILFNVINNFFGEYIAYNDSFDYYGSFISLLEHLMDSSDDYEYLDFRIGDYPDSREVDKNINEIFGEYI